MSIDGKWVNETVNPDFYVSLRLKESIYSAKSKFQEVDIVTLHTFGKCLMLDGHMQSSEQDEYIYHEALVHPALLTHPNPKRVFIAGGGEGATLREILKHSSVEKVIMVDIDPIVIDVCKRFLPNHSAGLFEDPRFELIVDDARAFIENYDINNPENQLFDIIIMDLCDPIEDGPAYLLYTQKFFHLLKSKLSPNGILVTQSGPGSINTMHEVFCPVFKTLSTVFPVVSPYTVYVPSFFDFNSFIIALNSNEIQYDPRHKTSIIINELIESKIKDGENALKYLDGPSYIGLFALGKDVKVKLAKTTEIITEDNPRFCFKIGAQLNA
eukprot:TRINITY_DN188_c0_g1_i1.p1 TRINITY_DN188_c0_g1~~TRINITY_DN188_c0_g1_i1.p1  ORF type:complete len:326 (+),score=140.13 TRINITY_DN188_c0_g1_i1:1232-2209(+)